MLEPSLHIPTSKEIATTTVTHSKSQAVEAVLLFGHMKKQHALGQAFMIDSGHQSVRGIKDSHVCSSSSEKWMSYLGRKRNAEKKSRVRD